MNPDLLKQIRDRKNASRLKPVGTEEEAPDSPQVSPSIPISPSPPSPVSQSPPLLPPTPPEAPSPPSSLDIEPAPPKPKAKKKKKPKPLKVEESKSINSGPQISSTSSSRGSSYHTYNGASSFSSESEALSAPFFLSTRALSCIASLDSSLSLLALYSVLARLQAPLYFELLAVLAEGLGLLAASVLFWRLHKLPVKTLLLANTAFLLIGNVILGLVYLIGYASPLLVARFFCGAGSSISLLGFSSIARLSHKREAAHRTVALAWQQAVGFLFGCLFSVGIYSADLGGFSSLFDRGNVHVLGLLAMLLLLLASLLVPQRAETKLVYQLYERSMTPNSITEEDEEQRGAQAVLLNNEEIFTLLAIYGAGTAAVWAVLGAHLQQCTQQLDDNVYAVFIVGAVVALIPKFFLKHLSRASTRSVMGSIVLVAAGCLGFSDVNHSTLLAQASIASVLLFAGFVCLLTQVPVALLHVASIPYFVILSAITSLAGRLGGLLLGGAVVTAANVEAVTRLGTALVFMGLLAGFATLRPSPPRVEQEASAGQGSWLNREL